VALGVQQNRIDFGKIKAFVDGPEYDSKNKKKNPPQEEYEKHQYIKIIAY